MKTKIVYAIVSDGKGLYFEKAFVSAWSVKYYNPSAFITVVFDDNTKSILDAEEYKNFKTLINEEIIIHFDEIYTNVEKSRWLKTNLRKIVTGDFLFLDVDTVVCKDLSDIDNETCSAGFTWDFNCRFDENPSRFYYSKLMEKYFNQKIGFDDYYFNSGIIYAKDDSTAHKFFNAWHNNWLHTSKQGYFRDQLSLLKTTSDLPTLVNEISGTYNCQISVNLKYFYDAKIIHFYKIDGEFDFSPFLGNEIYLDIRAQKYISKEITNKIINCKSIFIGPIKIIGGIDFSILESNIYKFINSIFVSHKYLLSILKLIAKFYIQLKK